jgi:Anti-sigma-K factor rskA, C-terminal
MRTRRGDEEELAALADGSIEPDRRAELEARIDASPILADRLAEQERAVALLRGAGDEVDAPAGLRERLDAQRSGRTVRAPRRLALGGIAVAAVAAAAVAVAVVVSSGSHGTRFQAALGPTPLASGASGEATLTRTPSGWRINLHATGLPRLEGDRFYEAWLRSSTGVLVPVGTFNEGENVTLWAGVSPASYKVLTVTRERADGNQASSGQKVLVGPVRTG